VNPTTGAEDPTGRVVAENTRRETGVTPTLSDVVRACESCGTAITEGRRDRRYCSPACRTAAHRAREKAARVSQDDLLGQLEQEVERALAEPRLVGLVAAAAQTNWRAAAWLLLAFPKAKAPKIADELREAEREVEAISELIPTSARELLAATSEIASDVSAAASAEADEAEQRAIELLTAAGEALAASSDLRGWRPRARESVDYQQCSIPGAPIPTRTLRGFRSTMRVACVDGAQKCSPRGATGGATGFSPSMTTSSP
jgi:RNA polymerase-binding transcription factor DksA